MRQPVFARANWADDCRPIILCTIVIVCPVEGEFFSRRIRIAVVTISISVALRCGRYERNHRGNLKGTEYGTTMAARTGHHPQGAVADELECSIGLKIYMVSCHYIFFLACLKRKLQVKATSDKRQNTPPGIWQTTQQHATNE